MNPDPTSESSPENPPSASSRPRLRVMNPDPTSKSSPDNPPPAPHHPRLRVMNPDPTSKSSPDNPSPTPNRAHLRVVNPDPTPESSHDKPPRLPNRPRLRVMNPDPTPESSDDKPPRLPNRPRLRVVNRTSSTPDSGHDNPSWRHAQAGDTRFTPEGRSRSTGEAIWFPDTGSGIPRYLESPDKYPSGLFKEDVIQNMIEDLKNPTEAEYDDTETEVTLEIDPSILQGGSTRPDIKDMVWRPPSRDSMQPQGRDEEEMSGSSDEPENMAFVRLLGLGITPPTNTLRQGSRMSRHSSSEPPEDDQMLDDYIEETDDEAGVRHSGIERGRSGDLGSSRISTSEDEHLWNDYFEDSDEEARLGSGGDGSDRIGRSRSRENSENRSRRSDGDRSRSGGHGRDGGGPRNGENDLGLTF